MGLRSHRLQIETSRSSDKILPNTPLSTQCRSPAWASSPVMVIAAHSRRLFSGWLRKLSVSRVSKFAACRLLSWHKEGPRSTPIWSAISNDGSLWFFQNHWWAEYQGTPIDLLFPERVPDESAWTKAAATGRLVKDGQKTEYEYWKLSDGRIVWGNTTDPVGPNKYTPLESYLLVTRCPASTRPSLVKRPRRIVVSPLVTTY